MAKLTKNTDIYDWKKTLDSCTPSTLSSLASEDSSTLGIFSSRLGGVLDGTSDDNWSDKITGKVSESITTIQGYVTKVTNSCSFISGAESIVTNLKTACESYVKEYDNYSAMGSQPSMYEKNADGSDKLNSSGHKIVSSDYLDWKRKMEAFEEGIPKLEEQAKRIHDSVANYFSAIDLTTNTIDGSIYSSDSSKITFNFADYLSGVMGISLEEWASKESEFYVDEDGNLVGKDIYYQYHCEYADGSDFLGTKTEEVKVQDINGDGVIDENDLLIYKKVHLDGEFTAPDGTVYKMTSDTVFDGNITKVEAEYVAPDDTRINVTSEFTDEDADGVVDEGGDCTTRTEATNVGDQSAQSVVDNVTDGSNANVTVDPNAEFGAEFNDQGGLDVTMSDVESAVSSQSDVGDSLGTDAADSLVIDKQGNQVGTQTHTYWTGESDKISFTVAEDGVSGSFSEVTAGNEALFIEVKPDPDNPGQYVETAYMRRIKYDGSIDESVPPYGQQTQTFPGTVVTKTFTGPSGETKTITYCPESQIGAQQAFSFIESDFNGGKFDSNMYDDGRTVMDAENGDTVKIGGVEYTVTVQ